MKLDRITSLLDDPGPFATAYAEVSRAQEDGDTLAELAARAAHDELVDQGAPASVAEQVRDRRWRLRPWIRSLRADEAQ